jgi:hypothetical protein
LKNLRVFFFLYPQKKIFHTLYEVWNAGWKARTPIMQRRRAACTPFLKQFQLNFVFG